MAPHLWLALALAVLFGALLLMRRAGRVARIRGAVLDEVRRALRGGVVDSQPGRGPQARGRISDLEITVDLYSDPARPKQSPMWRVLAVGPVRLERPMEVRTQGWQGWIDPWLQLGETVVVPGGLGPELMAHAEHPIQLDHPVVAALRRQGPGLGPGALHARPDLMRAEVRFGERLEDNRPLFAYLHAMGEISEVPAQRTARDHARGGVRTKRLGSSPHPAR